MPEVEPVLGAGRRVQADEVGGVVGIQMGAVDARGLAGGYRDEVLLAGPGGPPLVAHGAEQAAALAGRDAHPPGAALEHQAPAGLGHTQVGPGQPVGAPGVAHAHALLAEDGQGAPPQEPGRHRDRSPHGQGAQPVAVAVAEPDRATGIEADQGDEGRPQAAQQGSQDDHGHGPILPHRRRRGAPIPRGAPGPISPSGSRGSRTWSWTGRRPRSWRAWREPPCSRRACRAG